MGDGDVAANGFQFGAATDLTRADMPATSAQRSVSGNVTHVDVSAGGKGSEITRDIQNLNVSALRIESRHRAPPRSVAKPRAADASRLDISACVRKLAVPPMSAVVMSPAPVFTSTL